MAQAKTMNGSQLLVQVGDGADPEVFAQGCLINTSRGIAFSSSATETQVPDCDDPDLPTWIERAIDGLSAEVTGEGVLDTTNLQSYWDWFKSGEAKNIRVAVNVPGASGGGHWAMRAVLTSWSVNGAERRGKVASSLTMQSDGPVVWVDAA